MTHPQLAPAPNHSRGPRPSVVGLSAVSIAGVLVLAGAGQPPGDPRAGTPPAAPGTPPAAVPDTAAQLLAEARASFGRVRDYMGTLVKQERVGGQLQPEQFIELRVRQAPFSVYLKWQGPKQFVGQEAMFVAGKNNNEMRAKG